MGRGKKAAAEGDLCRCGNLDCDVAGRDKVDKKCARCLAVRYCSEKCQRQHWRRSGGNHRAHCRPPPRPDGATVSGPASVSPRGAAPAGTNGGDCDADDLDSSDGDASDNADSDECEDPSIDEWGDHNRVGDDSCSSAEEWSDGEAPEVTSSAKDSRAMQPHGAKITWDVRGAGRFKRARLVVEAADGSLDENTRTRFVMLAALPVLAVLVRGWMISKSARQKNDGPSPPLHYTPPAVSPPLHFNHLISSYLCAAVSQSSYGFYTSNSKASWIPTGCRRSRNPDGS